MKKVKVEIVSEESSCCVGKKLMELILEKKMQRGSKEMQYKKIS